MVMKDTHRHRSEAIYIVDNELRVLNGCHRYIGGEHEAQGETVDVCGVICRKDKSCPECLIRKALESGEPQSEQRPSEGGIVQVRVWPVSPECLCRKFAVVFWQDISSQKNMEAQLYHSQKLEAIGELAAGVAHEINNPLGFIYGNLRIMQEYAVVIKKGLALMEKMSTASAEGIAGLLRELYELDEQEDMQAIISDIDNLLADSLAGAARVTEIVSNLKSFARPDSKEKRDYSVNEGLQSTLKILNNELKYKCLVTENYGDVPDIECYPGELNQVFVNIIVNAAQSIAEHGEIGIRTWLHGDKVYVEISDTGCGIKESDMAYIFDPFFSTKPVGKGTGLGLSVSHGIVEKHGGRIMVKSKPGVGTVFTIELPVLREEVLLQR